MAEKIIELNPIREDTSYYDSLERKIKELFKTQLFFPLLKILNFQQKILSNAKPTALEDAIRSDRVQFWQGEFTGRFNASVSRELQSYGAKWDNKSSTYKINLSNLPFNIRNVISTSKARFEEKLKLIDDKLSKFNTDEFVDNLHVANIFDRTLYKVEKEFSKSVENITVAPQLSEEQRRKIVYEWQGNMRLWIKTWTEEQIVNLRHQVKENVYAGNRRENLIKKFQDQYRVSESKAKFWARQETRLLVEKYKEVKYVDAGINEYRWACVKMPHQQSPTAPYKAGEVRYSHGILEGKIFSWNDPPITTPPNQPVRRNNAGCDYNCRCFGIPLVRFK